MENLIKQIVGLGLPILGNALGGPFGGTVATMIAKWIGAPTSSPTDISKAISGTPNDVAVQKLKSAEAEYIAAVNAEATIGSIQVQQINETIRAELAAGAQIGGRMGRIVEFMQVSWRPLFAYETLVECCIAAVVFTHEVWTGDFTTLNAISQFQGMLMWYLSIKLGMLGVYVIGRSAEKINGQDAPSSASVIDAVVKGIRDKLTPAPVAKKK